MGLKPKYRKGEKVLLQYGPGWIPAKVSRWKLNDDFEFEYYLESIPTRENEPIAVYWGLESDLHPCEESSWDHEEV